MASSSRACLGCYMDMEDSPNCCLRRNENSGRPRLRLAKIECTLKDEVTRAAFIQFLRDVGNTRNALLVQVYGILHASGRSITKLRKIQKLLDDNPDVEGVFEQRLEEDIATIGPKKTTSDTELQQLYNDMTEYIIDELQDSFTNFVACAEKY